MKYEEQVAEAAALIARTSAGFGLTLGEACARAAQPVVTWIQWYRMHRPSRSGAELLDGARAAVLETIGYVNFGLGQAAISAIRTQVDLVLGYSFFREHPAEWRRVCETGEGFKLKSDVVKYHREIQSSFPAKLTIIEQASGLELDKYYSVLSAHIHGQNKHSTPRAQELKELVWTEKQIKQVVKLQDETANALSNFLLAVHALEWTELPPSIVSAAQKLLTPRQRPLFFTK